MAVTKIKAIRGTLSKAIAYILNPEKTDEKLLVRPTAVPARPQRGNLSGRGK